MYYVEFTHGNKSTVLHETTDKAAAMTFGEATATTYKAAKKSGVISMYTPTTERGIPARKLFKVWEL